MKKIIKRACLFILCFILAGCATKAPLSGLPVWDFQIEQNQLNQGVWQFNPKGSPATGSYILDFSPAELVAALSQALDKNSVNSQLIPNTLRNLVYPTYDFSFQPAINTQNKWSIAAKNDNLIVTGWRFVPGRTVGILWWEQEYETQVRHRVIVNKLNKAEQNTNFLITTEVRERQDKNLPWNEGLVEFGKGSFEEIKKLIVDTITSGSKVLSDVE